MKVIISAGGTGGHIYPALAIINKIKEKEPNSEILYIGTHNRMEKDIVPKTGIPFKQIETSQKLVVQIEGLRKNISRRGTLGIRIRLYRPENSHEILHHQKIYFQGINKLRQFQLERTTFRGYRLEYPINRDIHLFRNQGSFQQRERDISP